MINAQYTTQSMVGLWWYFVMRYFAAFCAARLVKKTYEDDHLNFKSTLRVHNKCQYPAAYKEEKLPKWRMKADKVPISCTNRK